MAAKVTKPERTLLDAIDMLTKPQVVANWNDGVIVRTSHPPLLDMLSSAITSDIGGSGSGKPARERTPFDIGAFQLYETIDGRVRSWLDDLGARPGKSVTPREALRTWYVLWSANPANVQGSLTDAFRSILEGWEQQIRDHLDPPKRIEITEPCPVCGVDWVNIGLDENDVERVRALIAFETSPIEESFARCSACWTTWMGVSAMRQLRILIDEAAAARLELSPEEAARVAAFCLDHPEDQACPDDESPNGGPA